MKRTFPFIAAMLIAPLVASQVAAEKPNVILIICDDLNDYVEGFGGHPQTQTPNMARLARSGVRFTQAHCNIPICGPSRASHVHGRLSASFRVLRIRAMGWLQVLQNSRTLMDHFRANGYTTLGTGKLMHHMVRKSGSSIGNPADYGPFAFDGNEKVAHPDVPAPYRDIGAVDGSFGPFVNIAGRTTHNGKPFSGSMEAGERTLGHCESIRSMTETRRPTN